MILLSLNIRGVGGSQKLASVQRLISIHHLEIIFLQETLVDEIKACCFISKLKLDWHMTAVNSLDRSRGLLVAWDPKKFVLKPFISCGGIMLSGYNNELKRHLTFLNVYGSCTEWKIF